MLSYYTFNFHLDELFQRYFHETFSMREKCPNTEFFWFIFFCIRTEYGDLLVNLRPQSEYRKMRTWKNSVFGQFSCSFSIQRCFVLSGAPSAADAPTVNFSFVLGQVVKYFSNSWKCKTTIIINAIFFDEIKFSDM